MGSGVVVASTSNSEQSGSVGGVVLLVGILLIQVVWLRRHWHDKPTSRVKSWWLLAYKVNAVLFMSFLLILTIAHAVAVFSAMF